MADRKRSNKKKADQMIGNIKKKRCLTYLTNSKKKMADVKISDNEEEIKDLKDEIKYFIANHLHEKVKKTLEKSKILFHLRTNIGETVLHLAVKHRCLYLIRWLLKNQLDINSEDFTKKTALHLAVSLKFDEVVEYLLYCKAKVDTIDNYGNSPFHSAVIGGNVRIIKMFLNHGVNIMSITKHHQTSFHLALYSENYEVFELLLQNYQGELDVTNKYQETVLHELARKKEVDLAKILLERKTNLEKVNYLGETPLLIATQIKGNHSMVKLLLEYGAKVNVENNFNESSLHIAVRNGDVEMIKLLLFHGANAKAVSHERRISVLHVAVKYYNQEVFNLLLNFGIDININDVDNVTPFHLAIRVKDKIVAKILLNKGADINSVSLKSWKMQHFELDRNYLEYKNLTPLHTAITFQDYDLVKFLLENGAKIDLVNQTETFIALDVESIEILELLLNYGAELNIANEKGESLIYIATKYSNANLVKFLLNNGARIDLVNHTETFAAVDVQSTEILELLINFGAQLNITNEKGESLLHRAARYCNKKLVETLLNKGANVKDISMMGTSDESALHIAVKGLNLLFIIFLLDLQFDMNLLDLEKHPALWYSEENYISELLIRHLAITIKVNNDCIIEEYQQVFETFPYMKSYYTRNLLELDTIKETKCRGTSLSILLGGNVISSTILLRNKDVRCEFKRIINRGIFPIYGDILKEKIKKAMQRNNLIKKAENILNKSTYFNNLYDIVQDIFLYYFSENELKKFVESFK